MSQPGFSDSNAADQHHLPPERSGWPLWPLVLIFGALALVLVVWFGFSPQPSTKGELDPSVGQILTSFRLQPLTGDSHPTTEADLDEKVTLVNFWGPWCGPCAMEFPHLVEVVAHFRSQPQFQFFSVASNQNPHDDHGLAESTAEFLKEFEADFPTYRDPDGETANALIRDAKIKEFGFPATVLLGPGGVIRALWIGYEPGDENAVRRAIEKELLKRAN
ncbi:MAG TPA: TlpA disulfide reductase family protein [Pirellulaceae bacterium]